MFSENPPFESSNIQMFIHPAYGQVLIVEFNVSVYILKKLIPTALFNISSQNAITAQYIGQTK